MSIREASHADFELIWPVFSEVVCTGDTYPYAIDTNKEAAFDLWIETPQKTFLIEENGVGLATYFIKPNQPGAGSHVCNCGYMVSANARGRGLATSLCKHSQEVAIALGYQAMQFNYVVSSNESAVKLWTKLGFETVGRLPKAFNHPVIGFVDALVMFKWLGDNSRQAVSKAS